MYIVTANSNRPDFRVLIDLLFDPGRNVDTSGNCRFPDDKSWTDVYIKDRESEQPHVVAYVPEEYWDDDDNCIQETFHIKSEHGDSEESVAIFLYDYCGHEIWEDNRKLSEFERNELRNKHSLRIELAKTSQHYTPPENAG